MADAAKLLSAAGGLRVTAEMIRADVDAGAPTNGDGTINLVHYVAWLVKQAVVRSPESAGKETTRATDSDRYRLKATDYGLAHGD